MKIDVANFFNSIDKNRLLPLIERYVPEAVTPAKEDDDKPMIIDVKNDVLPTTMTLYASQWDSFGDPAGKDGKRQVTMM